MLLLCGRALRLGLIVIANTETTFLEPVLHGTHCLWSGCRLMRTYWFMCGHSSGAIAWGTGASVHRICVTEGRLMWQGGTSVADLSTLRLRKTLPQKKRLDPEHC